MTIEAHIPSVHGETEHEWWYQPSSSYARLFGDNRGYWYCNVKDMGGSPGYPCQAKSFVNPKVGAS